MGINTLSQKLIRHMEEEIALLDSFAKIEESVRLYIRESDWENLNAALLEIEPVSVGIEKAEEQRGAVYTELREALGEPAQAGFYQVAVRLDSDKREQLSALYRTLKLSVIKIQGITWSIDAHVRAVGNTISQVLDELFPHRKGKIYGNTGESRAADSGPILINQSL